MQYRIAGDKPLHVQHAMLLGALFYVWTRIQTSYHAGGKLSRTLKDNFLNEFAMSPGLTEPMMAEKVAAHDRRVRREKGGLHSWFTSIVNDLRLQLRTVSEGRAIFPNVWSDDGMQEAACISSVRAGYYEMQAVERLDAKQRAEDERLRGAPELTPDMWPRQAQAVRMLLRLNYLGDKAKVTQEVLAERLNMPLDRLQRTITNRGMLTDLSDDELQAVRDLPEIAEELAVYNARHGADSQSMAMRSVQAVPRKAAKKQAPKKAAKKKAAKRRV